MFIDNISLWGSSLRQYLICFIIIILAFSAGKIVYWIISKIVKVFTTKTKTRLDDLIINLVDRPIVFLIGLWGLYLGLGQLSLSIRADNILDKAVMILFFLNISWVVINFLDAIIINYMKPFADKSKTSVDDAIVNAVGRLVKIILWVIVLIVIVTNLGYDVSALLAGLGLGGLAFALAAQDLLSNLFGGAAILGDKPFKTGDRIRFSGTNEGFVREIGFRTTRIETLDGTQLVVPNSELAKVPIENISKEPARKVTVKLGLVYDTSSKQIEKAEEILKDIFVKNKNLTDECYVGFSDFGDFAIIITAIYYIKEPVKTLKIKSEVNNEIKQRFEKAGLEFAYPTQKILLSQKSKRK